MQPLNLYGDMTIARRVDDFELALRGEEPAQACQPICWVCIGQWAFLGVCVLALVCWSLT